MATRSSFVREPASCVVFGEFPILLPVKKELGHLSWFRRIRPESVPWVLSENRLENLATPRQEFGISRQKANVLLDVS
jgi:hypothetical protein